MTVTQNSALAGRRVLEIADEKGVYCGKLFADMGADVVKIETPGGDATRDLPPFWKDTPHPERSLFFLYTNTNKRSVTLDLQRPEGQDLFRALAQTADVVIETLPPGRLDELGVGYAALSRQNPALVLTSITGFGQTGPYRDWKTADIVANALSGVMHVTGDADDPPVTLAGAQAYFMASTYAATSSAIALHHASTTGKGQHVDISVHEVMASVSHICGAGKYLDDGIVPRRMGTGLFASVPSGTYPCTDGLVYLMINRPLHWQALARWIAEVTGNDAVKEAIFDGPSSNRQPYRDLLDVYISDLTSRFSVEQIYQEGQRRHIAFTPVNGAVAVVRDAHLAARQFFTEVDHPELGTLRHPGAPYKHTVTPWRIARPAPRIGEHNEEVYGGELGSRSTTTEAGAGNREAKPTPDTQPPTPGPMQALAGLRVVEFSAGMAGPWIGRFMAWCGAEVIKVESKKHPDVTRQYVPPRAPEMGIQSQLSPWFTDWNAGKRFVALDLTRPEAVDLAKRIVATSDIVVENYSAGVLDKLGLGYERLREVNPDLIFFGSSGYGDSGPNRSYVTWGPNIEALSGLSTLSGFPERECTITQFAYPDAVSALHGLFAVMCAVDYRRNTGRGQAINLSQFEATVSVIGDVVMERLANRREPRRLGNRSLRAAPHGCYRCRGEDRWCAIAVFTQAEWRRFCNAIGHEEWTVDVRFATPSARLHNADELDRLLQAWTSERDTYEVMRRLQEAGVAAGVVQTVEDLLRRDPQLAARGFHEEIEHRKKGKVIAAGIPLGLTGTPGRTRGSGAAIGQDNDHVFGELLGLPAEEIRRLTALGAIETEG
jgi:crotonobetainyl-CoA:carnitine CoA-transferase CaiB-like acyl-CoA transferase